MSEHRSARFFSLARISTLLLFCGVMVISSHAQTFTKLVDFSPTTGEFPETALTQGFDGNLYGTTAGSGTNAQGTFFQMTPSGGTVTTLYNFCSSAPVGKCSDGGIPVGAVALGPDGNFYGTTQGYPLQNGTIYTITPAGALTTLRHFCPGTECSKFGAYPGTGLTLAWNGMFYGSAIFNSDWGRIFRITSTGAFQRLMVVCPGRVCPSDAGPNGTLVQASGGYLMGAGPGGANNAGAIYRMTPSGMPTIMYSFCVYGGTCHDPYGGSISTLIQSTSGNFLGVSTYGGSGAFCTATSTPGCGTAFRVTGGGVLTRLHDFCNWTACQDGDQPAALIEATDGNFYGVATGGGIRGGTVFKLTAGGVFTVLHTFMITDGYAPLSLIQATDGNLYGTTFQGGANGGGTIFRISLGLAPFVKTVQPAGKVGDSIIILGNNLTGSTSVSFNGTNATTFAVVSDTEITATVPSGASTGTIQIVTPGGTHSSNVSFPIHP